MNGRTSTSAVLLAAVLSDLEGVVGGTTAGQLHHSTPCSEWDVERLLAHVLGWLTIFAAGFADLQGRAPALNSATYQTPADRAVRDAATQLASAIHAGAAARPLWLGENAMPGNLALGMILWEYRVHGWDLARATAQSWSPPEAAALESLTFAPTMLTSTTRARARRLRRRWSCLPTPRPSTASWDSQGATHAGLPRGPIPRASVW